MIDRYEFEKLEGWFWWEEAIAMTMFLGLVKELDGVIVEVGSYKGKSTAVIASCTEDIVYAIDPFNWEENQLEKFKEQTSKYKNINCIVEDAVSFREKFDKPIKLLFIDCDHTYNLTKKIFELYDNLVVPGGIILLHDSSPRKYELEHLITDEQTNVPIENDEFGGWVGPTKLLHELRDRYQFKSWLESARSLHGIRKI